MFIPGTGQMLVYKREPSIFSGKPTFTVLAIRFDFAAQDIGSSTGLYVVYIL